MARPTVSQLNKLQAELQIAGAQVRALVEENHDLRATLSDRVSRIGRQADELDEALGELTALADQVESRDIYIEVLKEDLEDERLWKLIYTNELSDTFEVLDEALAEATVLADLADNNWLFAQHQAGQAVLTQSELDNALGELTELADEIEMRDDCVLVLARLLHP